MTRSDGSSYIIDGNDIRSHFQAEESGYGRINLLQNNEVLVMNNSLKLKKKIIINLLIQIIMLKIQSKVQLLH